MLRHWLILVVSMVVLAEGMLLGLYFLNGCIAQPLGWCRSPLIGFLFSNYGGPAHAGSVALSHVVSFFVLNLAIYFLFSSRGFASANDRLYLRQSSRRGRAFLVRTAIVWALLEVSIWLINFLLARLYTALPSLLTSAGTRWPLFAVNVLLLVGMSAYLRAKLAFYLPSMAFRKTPEPFGVAWRRTGAFVPRLFFAFLAVDAISAVAQFGLLLALSRSAAGIRTAELVASLLLTRSNFMLYALTPAAVCVLIAVPQTMIAAALSASLYRQATSPEADLTAEIFS